MPMAHRAFAFDHAAFQTELGPLLLRALATGEDSELRAFIDANLNVLVDPYEGEALTKNWQASLEAGDIQELADFALTKYYDGDLDIGLDVDWEAIGELLEKSGMSPAITLGSPLGAPEAQFDPGRQGAYFQTAIEVNAALSELQALLQANPSLTTELLPLQGMLQECARTRRGLYVTF